jgi:aryl-alcohol dehydrogenase-like predicted oxidoreductase
MTWGEQNNEAEGHAQIDYALSQGVNFIDTAEMYSVPPREETYGRTETFIGNWIQNNSPRRSEFILATKMAGGGVPWVRGANKINGKDLKTAVEDSLRRLQTDYIDLYQLHWPNRPAPQFARHWPGTYKHSDIDASQEQDEHLDILSALGECQAEGKILACGMSNDTPWGIHEYLRLAKENDLPKMVSLQNEFSLLHLTDAPHVLESCVLNDIAYLPWSPLAGGALSGKYMNGALPEGCRWTMNQRNGIFRDTSYSHAAIADYHAIAKRHNLSLTQMALAWVMQFDGVTSTIIGATSMDNLKENIAASELVLSEDVLKEIDVVIRRYPVPF